MAEAIRMPLLSDTMKEGVIAEWHKKIGDTVKSDDLLHVELIRHFGFRQGLRIDVRAGI